MKKLITLLLVIFSASNIEAQSKYKVQFILNEKTAIHHDSIYITGSFDNWDSTKNKNYLMKPIGNNEKSITLNLPKGIISYKFHRGSWFTVEKRYNGDEVPDRKVKMKLKKEIVKKQRQLQMT
jgi:hypothetical protein